VRCIYMYTLFTNKHGLCADELSKYINLNCVQRASVATTLFMGGKRLSPFTGVRGFAAKAGEGGGGRGGWEEQDKRNEGF